MMNIHEKQVSVRTEFKRLLDFMSPYCKKLVLALILTIISAILGGVGPFVFGNATDFLIKLSSAEIQTDHSLYFGFTKILVFLAGIYIFQAVFKFLSSKILVEVTQKTIFDLRRKTDKKLKKLPLSYFDTNTYGDILSRITNDIDMISNSLQQGFEQIITAVVTVVIVLGMMIWINPVLTLIGLATVPLGFMASMKIAKKSQNHFSSQQKYLGDLNGYIEEVFTGHNIVSAFCMQDNAIKDFEEKNEKLYESAWKAQFMSGVLMPLNKAMSDLGYVAIAVLSGIFVIQGRLSIGMIQSFILYLGQFSQPIMQIVQIMGVFQSTAAATSRVFEFLEEKEEVKNPEISKMPNNYTVEFENVQFGYSENLLMKNVNMVVPEGKKVAIVGPTGAGKTTLVNLLLRFYDVNSGSIKIGGVDIRDMKRHDLRTIFGMVLQDTWLFSGTIMENLRYGRLSASDDEIIKAAKMARADAFINALPDGYNFVLHEGAGNLAQGERQLLTIARAILANSPVMILDEATSSVDTRTEVLIQEAMSNLTANRTGFVIAHRLSTIRDADMIIYMDHGDILEYGNHNELLKKDGYYAKLYNSQFVSENEE